MRFILHITTVKQHQDGIGRFKSIAAIAGIGVALILLFIFASSPSPKTSSDTKTQDANAAAQQTPSVTSTQPQVIRIPDNYSTYVNKTYKFSFAYPTPWVGSVNIEDAFNPLPASDGASFFNRYVFGNSVLDGSLTAQVDDKDAFKLNTVPNGATVAPVKLGDSYGWKVVQASSGSPNLKVGDSYNVKSSKYQSNVTVYNFTYSDSNTYQTRWVFQSGDNFVGVYLPILNHPDGSAVSSADLALYTVISNNIAKTIRPTN